MGSNRIIVIDLAAVLVLGAGAGFFMYHRHNGPLPFTVTFKDAKQLRPGQYIVYKGVRVGEVKSVNLDKSGVIEVGVVVDAEHRAQICREATFRIEKPSLMDLSGEHQITVSDSGGSCTAITRDAVVQGARGCSTTSSNAGKTC